MAATEGITTAGRAPSGGVTAERGQVRLSWGTDLTTTLLATWLMIGLFVDGWAHNNLTELETFFTPWHAQFYSGFVATAGWMLWQADRARRPGDRRLAAVPRGYGLGLVGAGIFAAGGLGDMLWHETFGIETDVDALFSPTHLVLFVGLTLILSTPLRAAWLDPSEPTAPGYKALLPAVLSTALLAALVAFMFQFWTAFVETYSVPAPGAVGPVDYFPMMQGIAGIFALSLVLTAPLLLLARRWRPPPGTATTLFAVVGVLLGALHEFAEATQLLALVVSGAAVDVLLVLLRPSPTQRRRFWAAGLLAPVVTWTIYFALLMATDGIGWVIEMWTGAILWAGLLGLALALLMLPPRVPPAVTADDGAAATAPPGARG